MVTDRVCQIVQPRLGTLRGRSALTTLEFVGCVTAVIGGAWLGAIYLGVDLRHLAHTVLAQAELLDKVPPEWRPPSPNQNVMTREQLVSTLRKELGSLRSELVALRTAAGDNGGPERITDAVALTKEKTRAYWARLSEIALNETDLQQDAETALNETNAAKVFAIKGRISRFAAKTVQAVPSDNVDASAIQFGQQLGEWYDRAGALYERAVEIWESPARSQGRTQLNKDWRGAELQHRHEARLLNERAATVRSSLSRQYGEEFPEFAKPAAAAPPAKAGESTRKAGQNAAEPGEQSAETGETTVPNG